MNSNADRILSEIKNNTKFQSRFINQGLAVKVTSFLQYAIDFIKGHECYGYTKNIGGGEIYHMKDGSRILRDGEEFYIDSRTT